MANIKITGLTELTTVTDSANILVPIVSNGTSTLKITLANLGRGVFPSLSTAVPVNSSGVAGDKAGDMVFSASFLYYCVTDFVAPGTQCWERIAKDATAW